MIVANGRTRGRAGRRQAGSPRPPDTEPEHTDRPLDRADAHPGVERGHRLAARRVRGGDDDHVCPWLRDAEIGGILDAALLRISPRDVGAADPPPRAPRAELERG